MIGMSHNQATTSNSPYRSENDTAMPQKTTQNELFEPIDHQKLSELVAIQVEDLIISGVLRPGQKLPAERELAEQLGVSRPKLREGLQILESNGLVEIHKSDGAFISQLIGNALSPAMVTLYSRRQAAFFDFLEYRREQESFAAYLAAQRATEADLESMDDILAAMDQAHTNKQSALESELDVKFHMLIIESSHNSLLMHVMRSIYALMNDGVFYNRDFLYEQVGVRELLLNQHRAIVHAIQAKDPDAAAQAAEEHLYFVEKSYKNIKDEKQRLNISRKRQHITRESISASSSRSRRRKAAK